MFDYRENNGKTVLIVSKRLFSFAGEITKRSFNMTGKDSVSGVRQRIVDTARELFVENGFEGTSVRDIANASGTNVAMVNYYFQSKTGLFEVIFKEAFDILVTRIFAVLGSDRPVADVVESWINTYYDLLVQYPQIPSFILTAASHNPSTVAGLVESYNPAEVFEHFAGLVERDRGQGLIGEYPAMDIIINIVSLCVFPFVMGPLVRKITGISADRYDEFIHEHKEHVIDFVRNALVV